MADTATIITAADPHAQLWAENARLFELRHAMCAWRMDGGRARLYKDVAREQGASEREIARAYRRVSADISPGARDYRDLDAYIAAFPPDIRLILERIRQVAREVAPQAEERISYGMPALFQDGVLVYYAAFKKHIGLYPPVADAALRPLLARYAGPKGNLKFPLDEPIPYDLVGQVVAARLQDNARRREAGAAGP